MCHFSVVIRTYYPISTYLSIIISLFPPPHPQSKCGIIGDGRGSQVFVWTSQIDQVKSRRDHLQPWAQHGVKFAKGCDNVG